MDSRHLGPIALEGGVGGGWMDAKVDLGGSPVPLRLEIDFPDRFDQSTVKKVDFALDSLSELDMMARSSIKAALEQTWSSPAQLFSQWKAETNTPTGDVETFLSQLHPLSITILPDGGRDSLDRVVIVYSLGQSATMPNVTVRFREGIGPELDPAPYSYVA